MKTPRKLSVLGYTTTLFLFFFLILNCTGPSATDDLVEETDSNGISGNIPLIVGNDPALDTTQSRPAFDRFSWNTFIALNWPQDTNQVGVPLNPNNSSTFLNMTNTTPVVWTSFKNQYDLYGQGMGRPPAWDSTANYNNLCGGVNKVKHVFGTSKTSTMPAEDDDESFSVPLIDQDSNYALFEIRYNQTHYDFVRGTDGDATSWKYLKDNLVSYQQNNDSRADMPASDTTTMGALMMKAAWKEVSEDEAANYYVIDEEIYDPVSGKCEVKKLGLVGLHIAQKLVAFQQWVWSSFEHRNNVPGQGAQTPYSFNNGTDTPATSGGFANKPDSSNINPDKSTRVPVQVTRLNDIPTTPADSATVDINSEYWTKLAGTVWTNYQLVITQWPTSGDSTKLWVLEKGEYPTGAGTAFPAFNCVNTTMETYYQSRADARDARDGSLSPTGRDTTGNSCIGCHYTAAQTDYSWSMQMRSYETEEVATPSFATDIVPMLYQWRPQMLNAVNLDLTDYSQVSSQASNIYGEISSKSMPPDPYPKLTQEEINTFKNWMDTGKKQ